MKNNLKAVFNFWHLRSANDGWKLYHTETRECAGTFATFSEAEKAWDAKFKEARTNALQVA